MEAGTYNGPVSYPRDFIAGSSFALVEIENVDFALLLGHQMGAEANTETVAGMLLKDLGNVYYLHLIPEKVQYLFPI
jgi:HD-like signal output (HDOD) protein